MREYSAQNPQQHRRERPEEESPHDDVSVEQSRADGPVSRDERGERGELEKKGDRRAPHGGPQTRRPPHDPRTVEHREDRVEAELVAPFQRDVSGVESHGHLLRTRLAWLAFAQLAFARLAFAQLAFAWLALVQTRTKGAAGHPPAVVRA